MDVLLPLALSLVLSRQELRFSPVPEQAGPLACGDTVVAALLGEAGPLESGTGDRAIDLGEIEARLRGGGLPARALILDTASLDDILGLGFAPLVVHYARPIGHFAILFRKTENSYELGDPARGFEILPGEEFEARWSGGAVVVDPAGLPPGLVSEAASASERVRSRLRLLASVSGSAGASGNRGGDPAGLSLACRLSLPPEGTTLVLPVELSLGLRGGPAHLGLSLPMAWSSDGGRSPIEVEAPSLSASFFAVSGDWIASTSLEVNRGGFEDGNPRWTRRSGGTRVGLELSRILDPVLVGISVSCALPRAGVVTQGNLCQFQISATEVLSERFFLRLETALRLEEDLAVGRAWRLGTVFGITFGMSGPAWLATFAMRDFGDSRAFLVEASADLAP